MTSERRIEVETEVPASPEQAWEAIATGPGITAWFMPAEVDGRIGGSVVHHHDGVTSSSGTVTEFDPPHRFAYTEEGEGWTPESDEDAPTIATEFLVEARSGSTCVVRIVMSGFGEGDAWDRAIESFTEGWRQSLVSLRLYLAHFRGEPVAPVTAGDTVKGAKEAEWLRMAQALGIPADPRPGERVATTAPGAPLLAGVVEEAGDRMLTLVLDEPARGIGFVGVGGPGSEEMYLVMRAQLFGADAAEAAAREQEAWSTWFTEGLSAAAAR